MSVALFDGRGGDPVDLGEVRRQPLHERVAAERDDPRDVLALLRGQATRACRRAPPRARPSRRSPRGPRRTRRRGGPPAARAGARPARRRAPTAAARAPRARPAAGPRPSRRRDARWSATTTASRSGSRQQRERRVERDAHQAPRPAARAPRNRRHGGAPQAGEGVALVDQPLRGEHEQRDEHDRDPQLVTGVGPVAGGDGAAAPAPGSRPGSRRARGGLPEGRQLRGVAGGDAGTRPRPAGPPRSAPGRRGRRAGTWARRRARPGPTATRRRRGASRRRAGVGVDGAGDASGIGDAGHGVDAQQLRPGERDAGGVLRRGHELVRRCRRAAPPARRSSRPGSRA